MNIQFYLIRYKIVFRIQGKCDYFVMAVGKKTRICNFISDKQLLITYHLINHRDSNSNDAYSANYGRPSIKKPAEQLTLHSTVIITEFDITKKLIINTPISAAQ